MGVEGPAFWNSRKEWVPHPGCHPEPTGAQRWESKDLHFGILAKNGCPIRAVILSRPERSDGSRRTCILEFCKEWVPHPGCHPERPERSDGSRRTCILEFSQRMGAPSGLSS